MMVRMTRIEAFVVGVRVILIGGTEEGFAVFGRSCRGTGFGIGG